MHILRKVKRFIRIKQLFDSQRSLVAVSGGLDSATLAHILYTLGYKFVIAHANFGLRGADAQEDATFVQTLASHYGVPYFTKTFATQAHARQHHQSLQEAARHLRYNWFNTLCRQHQLGPIATGHHAGDSLETALYNLTKGTGIAGTRGMIAKQPNVVHPLLTTTKEELLTYANACQLSWREDSSNSTTYYQRNLLRHKVLPTLQRINPSLLTTWQHTSERLQQVEALFQEEASTLYPLVWHPQDPYVHLDLRPLAHKPWTPSILSLWLAPLGFRFVQLQRWWNTPPQAGRTLTTPTHWLLATHDGWVLGPQGTLPCAQLTAPYTTANTHQLFPTDTQCHLAGTTYTITRHPAQGYTLPKQPYHAALDAAKLTFPLLLRPWKAGDYLYPLGMQHRKKVSDLLTDHKVPRHRKATTMVLTSAQEIVWVVSFQIHEHYKVTANTQEVYSISATTR